jgi:hypothetical protein
MKYIFKLIIILLTFTLVSYDQKHFLNIPGEVEKVLVEAERQRQKENEVSLVSAKGVDYRKLRDLLKAKKWKEADAETRIVMLKVASKLRGGLNYEDVENFSCQDLGTIDKLWVKYSNGKFGFSVQRQIYQSLGGTKEYNREIWDKFGDKVGWRKVGQWLSYEKHNYRDKFEIHDVGHLLPAGALPTHTFANNLESRRDSPEIRRIAKSNPNNHLGFFWILSTTILFNCI